MTDLLSRRHLLLVALASLPLAASPFGVRSALADKGGDDGGGDDSGGDDDDGHDDSDDGDDDSGSSGNRDGSSGRGDDHEDVRAAVKRGEILSLREILSRSGVEKRGRVIDIELRSIQRKNVYVITLRRPDGSIRRVRVDAVSGKVM
ncbi:PepSY domain-containing protein [Allorhizobium borbori]|uniref:Putative membrane protein YkoI n=1 Tax=Allorhizobium borbori TaxID=485907 RepID=A0A7W6K3W9_9HYPH|nr:hypothetical protein [Allorhizobium borbori]MBB4103771.1 putative membrane protein YkoI [Allorhizobium borbori]